jgi:putative endonuclease
MKLRLAQHHAGEGGTYSAARLPVRLVFSCEFSSEHEAFLRERQIKGWSRRKKEALIRGDYKALIELSKSQTAPNSDSVD